jgi:hypothetical protein
VPPAVPLLTIIRLTEDVMTEVQKRACPPAESFIFTLRLKMWPVFQKAMTEHVDALKKLAEGASAGYFSRAVATTDVLVSNACTPVHATNLRLTVRIDMQALRRDLQLVCDADGASRRDHDFL